MDREQVAMFVDYENIRIGLSRHFRKRVPEDIPVRDLLKALKTVAEELGVLYEAHIFGDWTLRPVDAREVEGTPHFRAQLVLRADSKKDRTDPAMNFFIDDFYREKSNINNIIVCAGDADYCEVVRRGRKIHKNIYVCAVGPQTAPELLSLAKAFYPIEQRLGLKPIDVKEIADAMAKLDPNELIKWAPLVKQLDTVERRLPYVVRSHFMKQYMTPGLGYGDTFEQKEATLDLAGQLELVEFDRVPGPKDGMPVRTVRLRRDHTMVKTILAGGS